MQNMEVDRTRSIQFEEQFRRFVEHGGVKVGTKILCLQCSWKLKCSKEKLSLTSKGQGHPENEEIECYRCNGDTHPIGQHTIPYVDWAKTHLHPESTQASFQSLEAKDCRSCRAHNRSSKWCGSCGTLARPGEALHCFKHCVEFIRARSEDRLEQVEKCRVAQSACF